MTAALAKKIEALFRRYRRDAVLLYRPYPPHQVPRTNSKFGGLPNLPSHYDWPRTSGGTPLHFLAQIDCSEIPFQSALPERGTFFFFGRDDEEQIWHHYGQASDDCRVLFALDAFGATPPRPAPDDLPAIGGYYPRPAWRDLLRKGEEGPNIHVEWPIRLLRMDSWPDASGVPDLHPVQVDGLRAVLRGLIRPQSDVDAIALIAAYEDRLKRKRSEAFVAATGRDLEPDEGPALARDHQAGTAIFSDPEWPRHWIYIHYAARAALHRPTAFWSGQGITAEEIASGAERWLDSSRRQSLEDEVPEEDRQAFRAWISTIRHPEETRVLGAGARMVHLCSVAAIRSWAGSSELADRISPALYEALAWEFSGWSYWGVQFSQMLGHAPSAQEARSANDPTVCLLSLASETALGWMFGDMGEASFWITPQDLAWREFGKVWGTIEGH